MDVAARRPVRPPERVRRLAPEPRPHAVEGALPEPMPLPAGAPVVEKRFEVLRRDLDVARHANNTRYVEWALETLPETAADAEPPRSFDIVFRREAVRGDFVLARSAPEPGRPGRHLHLLVREKDGEELARAESVGRGDTPW